MYNLIHLAIKTSILLFYKRIFALSSQRFRYVWYSTLVYVIICAIIGLAFAVNMCKPIRFAWEQTFDTSNGDCPHLIPIRLGAAATLLIADVIILIMPIPMLWSLQMKLSRKVQLIALFGIGFLLVKSFHDSFSDLFAHLLMLNAVPWPPASHAWCISASPTELQT